MRAARAPELPLALPRVTVRRGFWRVDRGTGRVRVGPSYTPQAVRPTAAVWIWNDWSAPVPRPFLPPQVWLSPGRAVRVARRAAALLARGTGGWVASWLFRARGRHSLL